MDLIGGGTDNTWVLAGPNGRVISGIECTCIPAALDGVTAEELEDLLTTGVTAMVVVAAGGAGEDTICTVGTEVDEEGGNISWVTS